MPSTEAEPQLTDHDRWHEDAPRLADRVGGGRVSAQEVAVGRRVRTVRRWIRVARYASPREEEKYGAAKLDEVLRYLDALSGGELKGRLPVSFGDLRIPAEREGRRRRLRIEEATTEEIRAATRVKTKKPARSTASPQARAVQAALRARGLGDLDVRVVKGHLRLGAIPLARIADLAAALRAVKLPP